MKSNEFLQAAIDVQKERGAQYDKPSGERSMGATVAAFNCITGFTLEESDGWMLLSILKLVRQSQNPEKYHHDSALDFVAYASLYAEAASEQCKPATESNKNNQDPPSWLSAPKWAEWLAQNESGRWCWYEKKPLAVPAETSDDVGEWDIARTEDEFENSVMGMPNQYWYSTLVSRPQQ